MTLQIKRMAAYAAQMRYDVVRMIECVNSGHPGGALSCVDIIACLYFGILRLRPEEPQWPDRDRFILSKGHAAPALYAGLARRGYFHPSDFTRLRQVDGHLQGHPDRLLTPGVDMTTGCLGEGLSVGVGMALAGRIDKKDYFTYVLLSDGEMNEGQVWEAAQAAAHYQLDHLVAILDLNSLQFDGPLAEVINPFDLAEKWKAFGWSVSDIDGHDHGQILSSISEVKSMSGVPHMIIAHTIKGKGVPVMENECAWHSLVNRKTMQDSLSYLAEELVGHAHILDAPDVW